MSYCPKCHGTFTKNHCIVCCETYSKLYNHCQDCCHTYLNSLKHCKKCHKTVDETLKVHCQVCCFESVYCHGVESGIYHCCECKFISTIKNQHHCHTCRAGFDPTKQCHCCQCGTMHSIGTDHCHDCKKSFPIGECHTCENFCKMCKKTWLPSQKHCNDCHENFLKKFPHKQCKQKPTGHAYNSNDNKKEQNQEHTSVPKTDNPKIVENLKILGYFEVNPPIQKQKPTTGGIVSAYRRIALMFHPDKNFGIDTTEQFKKIQNAFDWLKTTLKI